MLEPTAFLVHPVLAAIAEDAKVFTIYIVVLQLSGVFCWQIILLIFTSIQSKLYIPYFLENIYTFVSIQQKNTPQPLNNMTAAIQSENLIS